MMMRILQAGNANFGYVLAKELRKRGIESDLLISKEIISGDDASVNDPLSHDTNIDSYPDWVHFGPINSRTKFFQIKKIMKNYDLIHAYNAVPIHAMFSGKPYVAQSGGDDLRIKAYEKSLTGFFLKRAYKKANQFIYVWPIHKTFAEKLRITNPLYLPRIWNTESFKRKNLVNPEPNKLSIFLPTAEIWDTKGNDKFLRAFVKLCKDNENVFLYFVDWGKDSSKAKELLNVPQVKGKVEIIPGPISREKMSELMEKCDILVDQFNSGSFTRMAIEAFNFEIPILINLDEKLHAELHGESPPAINAKSEEEIYTKLKDISHSKDILKKIAKEAKLWSNKNFDLQRNVSKYIEIYEKILKK